MNSEIVLRPEQSLKETAYDMLSIIFDQSATFEECDMAISTLVEIVKPEKSKKVADEFLQS